MVYVIAHYIIYYNMRSKVLVLIILVAGLCLAQVRFRPIYNNNKLRVYRTEIKLGKHPNTRIKPLPLAHGQSAHGCYIAVTPGHGNGCYINIKPLWASNRFVSEIEIETATYPAQRCTVTHLDPEVVKNIRLYS